MMTGRDRGIGFVVFVDATMADQILQEKHTIYVRLVDTKKSVSRDEQQNFTRSSIDVVVTYDHNTQCPRNFGFITFDIEGVVDKVLQKCFNEFNEKMVEVKRAVSKELSTSSTGRRPAAGGFGVGAGHSPKYRPAMNGGYEPVVYGGASGYGTPAGYGGYSVTAAATDYEEVVKHGNAPVKSGEFGRALVGARSPCGSADTRFPSGGSRAGYGVSAGGGMTRYENANGGAGGAGETTATTTKYGGGAYGYAGGEFGYGSSAAIYGTRVAGSGYADTYIGSAYGDLTLTSVLNSHTWYNGKTSKKRSWCSSHAIY